MQKSFNKTKIILRVFRNWIVTLMCISILVISVCYVVSPEQTVTMIQNNYGHGFKTITTGPDLLEWIVAIEALVAMYVIYHIVKQEN